MATAIPALPPLSAPPTEASTGTSASAGQPSFEQVLHQQRTPSGATSSPTVRSKESTDANTTSTDNPESATAAGETAPVTAKDTHGKATAEQTTTTTADGRQHAQTEPPPALSADGDDPDAEPVLDLTPTDLVDLSLAALAHSKVTGPALPVGNNPTPGDANSHEPGTPVVPKPGKAKATTRTTSIPGGKLPPASTPGKTGPAVEPPALMKAPAPQLAALSPDATQPTLATAEPQPNAAAVVTNSTDLPIAAGSQGPQAASDAAPQANLIAVQVVRTTGEPTADVVAASRAEVSSKNQHASTPTVPTAGRRPTDAVRGATAMAATPQLGGPLAQTAASASDLVSAADVALPAAVANAPQAVEPSLLPAAEPPTVPLAQALADIITPTGLESGEASAAASTTAGQHHPALAATPSSSPQASLDRAVAPQTGGTISTHPVTPIIIDRVRFVQRVARAFHVASQREAPLRLRLSPPELGSLRIEIHLQNGVMNARLEAETPAAQAALIEGYPALRERLAEQKIRLDRFDVDLLQERSADGSPRQPPGGPHEQAERAVVPAAGHGPKRRSATSESRTPRRAGWDPPGQLNVIV